MLKWFIKRLQELSLEGLAVGFLAASALTFGVYWKGDYPGTPPDLTRYLSSIWGLVFLFYFFAHVLFSPKRPANLICLSCQTVHPGRRFRRLRTCTKCRSALEPLDGFYDRHPEIAFQPTYPRDPRSAWDRMWFILVSPISPEKSRWSRERMFQIIRQSEILRLWFHLTFWFSMIVACAVILTGILVYSRFIDLPAPLPYLVYAGAAGSALAIPLNLFIYRRVMHQEGRNSGDNIPNS